MVKKIVLTIFSAIIFGGACSIVYARIVPGVDRPFNPSAYYSMTDISYEDSTPSAFALREIARGSVYDYTRDMKSLLALVDFNSLYNVLSAKTKIDTVNAAPLSKEQMEKVSANLQKINATTINQMPDVDINNNNLFHTEENFGTGKEYDSLKQAEYVETKYKAAVEAAYENEKDLELQYEALNIAMANAANAEGANQIAQAQVEVDAINAAIQQRKNMLTTHLMVIENLEAALYNDEKLEAEEYVRNNRLIISDPYTQKDRNASVGMPDF